MRGTRPLIGITCRPMNEHIPRWWDTRQGAISTMMNAVIAGGGIPLLLPIIESEASRELYELADGLILVGGGDLNSRFYNQEPTVELDRLDTQMDKWELTLASWAVLDQKPVFGICRGMQVMNVAMGGTLHQEIANAYTTEINHRASFHAEETAKTVHGMEVAPDSRLASVLGATSLEVNSLHHQSLDAIATDLRVVALAPDGVVEAAEGRNDHYIMLIQSHPEAVAAADPRWQGVYNDFIEVAGSYGEARRADPLIATRLQIHHS